MTIKKRQSATRVIYRTQTLYLSCINKFRLGKFKLLGADIGVRNIIGKVLIPLPEQILIGDDCEIEDYVRLRAGGPWKQATISIGNKTFIGHSSQINVGSPLFIGNSCMIAPMCLFSDANHAFTDLNVPINSQPYNYSSINIHDDVWVGSGCIILGGVTIGKGAVVAAGAVVNKDIPAYEVWGGIPAKRIKSRK